MGTFCNASASRIDGNVFSSIFTNTVVREIFGMKYLTCIKFISQIATAVSSTHIEYIVYSKVLSLCPR